MHRCESCDAASDLIAAMDKYTKEIRVLADADSVRLVQICKLRDDLCHDVEFCVGLRSKWK